MILPCRRAGLLALAIFSLRPTAQAQDATTLSVNVGSADATSATLTATVTDKADGTKHPTGTVNFAYGGATPGTCTLATGSCQFQLTLSSVPKGTAAIDVSYPGAAGFSASTAKAYVPQISFAPSPLNAASGSTSPVKLTVTITSGGGAPTGDVSLSAKTGTAAKPDCKSSANSVTCSSTYTPDASMTGSSTYSQDVTASIAAKDTYLPATQSDDVTIGASTCAGCFATFGLGVSINYKHYTDYNVATNVIQSTNLGNASPQLLAGVSYQLPWHGIAYAHIKGCEASIYNQDVDGRLVYCYPWRAFVNAKFSPTASQTVNGFTVGTSYRLAKKLDLLIGISLNAFNEVTPGFRAAAVQTTQAQQKAGNPNYTSFDVYAMQHNFRNAFDGFPTQLQQYSCTSATPPVCSTSTGPLIFNGSATGVQYLPGLFFGVVVPIELKSLFGAK